MAIVIRDPYQFQSHCLDLKKEGLNLGFVPTMGALHQGHLHLVEKALSENDHVVVSIFVNPTQFDDENDLESYPDLLDEDLKLLNQLGVHCVFTPHAPSMYPDNYKFKVVETDLSQTLCGQYRSGHFEGVMTIVLKLLQLSQATRAYFGEKDYQQLLLIKNMVRAFFIPTEVVGVSVVRDENGLALSSRNLKLKESSRKKAALLYEQLKKNIPRKALIRNLLQEGFEVEYIEDMNQRRFGAVYLDGVRLIDNVKIQDSI